MDLREPTTPTQTEKSVTGSERMRWSEVTEDAVGFGTREWATARDMLREPALVLQRYLTLGPTGGGVYRRPFGFYMSLCGIAIFWLFLAGGATSTVMDENGMRIIRPLLAEKGKSEEGFTNDFDDAFSALVIPMGVTLAILFSLPLFRRWLGTTRPVAMRAALAMFCIWSLPVLMLGPLPYLSLTRLWVMPLVYVLFLISFLRAGEGTLFHGRAQGVRRGLGVIGMMILSSIANAVPLMIVSTLYGIYR